MHPQGDTLPEDERVFRIEVVETFLKAGVAFNKTKHFRSLLERHGARLADRPVLTRLIPVILEQEKDIVKSSISGKQLSVVFDGSTRLGKALAIVVRFWNEEWRPKQKASCPKA